MPILFQKRLKVAEIRIDEESSEKVRWEERCRNWRQCAEQAKVCIWNFDSWRALLNFEIDFSYL